MNLQTGKPESRAAVMQVSVLLGALVLLILAGYAGFRTYAASSDLGSLNLYALAMIAGVASFFSPCAFPLLPSYFSFYHQAKEGSTGSSARLGAAAGLGVMTFDLLLGSKGKEQGERK